MIYCIWYPSGGFGHFINGILTLYGEKFARPKKNKIKFSITGNAHSLDLVAPKYKNNYKFNFDPKLNYSVLIDNGINDETTEFLKDFSTSTIIKICYSKYSWPIVARTMIEKAMASTLEQQLPVNFVEGTLQPDWAVREKYFLFLRDHSLAHAWKPSSFATNLSVDDMLHYQTLAGQLRCAGLELKNFFDIWQQWYQANQIYLEPVLASKDVIDCLITGKNRPLTEFNTHWAQAVLYYFIFLEFGKEVPHNDHADFFINTNEIQQWLDQ
jgi:hypothetical protein